MKVMGLTLQGPSLPGQSGNVFTWSYIFGKFAKTRYFYILSFKEATPIA